MPNNRVHAKLLAWEILGNRCQCCGSTENLVIDHIVPIRTSRHSGPQYQDVIDHPGDFQALCADCNRWKSDGPCCPCQWWDAADTSWRDVPRSPQKRPYKWVTNEEINAVLTRYGKPPL